MNTPELKYVILCAQTDKLYTPRYETDRSITCHFNRMELCRCERDKCLHCIRPKPMEHYKYSHLNVNSPKDIPDGGYYEMVQLGRTDVIVYFMYSPIYI